MEKINIKEKIEEIGLGIFFCAVVLLALSIVYLIISNLCSLYKPTSFVCTDVYFQVETTHKETPLTSNLTNAEMEVKRKVFLGRPISISWYDNDLKLIIVSENLPETYILSKRNNDHYIYENSNGFYVDLFIDRTVGYLKKIYLYCYTEDENGKLKYSYSLALTPQ